MQIKRYEVKSIHEALVKINAELGPEAIIISTKRIKDGDKSLMEVMAARDETKAEPQRQVVLNLEEPSRGQDDISLLKEEIARLKAMITRRESHQIEKYLVEIHEAMDTFMDVMGLKRKHEGKETQTLLYYNLLNQGLSKTGALKMTEELAQRTEQGIPMGYQENRKLLAEIIKERLADFTGGITGKKIKAFIGPTGVGKTTTLAKLAAYYSFERKMAVGLITADPYRIAALEQLRVYANIMNLPLEVATDRWKFKESLERLKEKDVILVDTPGRSPSEEGHLEKLGDLLNSCEYVEKSLLLSLTTGKDHLVDLTNWYNEIGYDNIIITKVDECRRCGLIYDLLTQVKRPVSYITCGQNVPQDILLATPPRLAKLVMESSVN